MKAPMQYIDDCYSVKKYLKCYDPCILPVNRAYEWEDVDVQPPMSPTYGRVSRRPKKQRRKSGDEIQQTKDQARREEAGVAASQIREQGQKTQANQKDMSFSQLDDMIVDNSVRGNTSNAKKRRTKTSRNMEMTPNEVQSK
nr:uncharacterized protein LOC113725580 isoform X2 [Coffea arabica]XP_027104645.1 uncharacterized protein LOC113725581 isoform X2 [Coffea arabica]